MTNEEAASILSENLMYGLWSWRPRSSMGPLFVGILPVRYLARESLKARWDREVHAAQMVGLLKPRIRIRVHGVPAP